MANILGINISDLSAADALAKIVGFLAGEGQHYVVTPNPEIILAAAEDEELFYVLNKADISLADGFGLKVAGWILGEDIKRATGSDMTLEILKRAAKDGHRVMVLNWRDGLSTAEEISSSLKEKFPGLNFSVIDISREKFLEADEVSRINAYAPVILFNTLGISYQEKLMFHNLRRLPSVKVALGVGGSFDFITGQAKRAPKTLRVLGLEWLWRLLVSLGGRGKSRRFRRIYRAIFVFLGKILKVRLINCHCYRQNVACFVYRRGANGPEVLIVEREDLPDHWQLPQGGTDGEPIDVAGLREAREELGSDKFRLVATFKDIYRYDFLSPEEKKAKRDNKLGFRNFKGQSQSLMIAEFIGRDEEIKINFWDHRSWRWVPTEDLVASVSAFRRRGCEIFLEKFRLLDIK